MGHAASNLESSCLILSHPDVILETYLVIFGSSWVVVRLSWASLGTSWAYLGPSVFKDEAQGGLSSEPPLRRLESADSRLFCCTCFGSVFEHIRVDSGVRFGSILGSCSNYIRVKTRFVF